MFYASFGLGWRLEVALAFLHWVSGMPMRRQLVCGGTALSTVQ